MDSMEYYKGITAVTVDDLTRSDDGEAIISHSNYGKLMVRHRINILRRGGGQDTYALIEYSSLPKRFRERFEAKYGNPDEILRKDRDSVAVAIDVKAREFFAAYRLSDGAALQEDFQREYTVNASVLNTLLGMVNTQKALRGACNNNTPVNWDGIMEASENLRAKWGHTLPRSAARLKAKMREYSKEGYPCLVSGKLGNSSALKVTEEAARYLVALRRSRTPVYSTAQILAEFNSAAPSRGWKPLRSAGTLNAFFDRPEIRWQ